MLINVMETRYDKETFTMRLPEVFDHLAQTDKGELRFELVKSNTLQPMNLIFDHNSVTRSVAFIFVNSECNGLEYKNHNECGETAYNLLKHTLEFKEVTTFTDLSKANILEKIK